MKGAMNSERAGGPSGSWVTLGREMSLTSEKAASKCSEHPSVLCVPQSSKGREPGWQCGGGTDEGRIWGGARTKRKAEGFFLESSGISGLDRSFQVYSGDLSPPVAQHRMLELAHCSLALACSYFSSHSKDLFITHHTLILLALGPRTCSGV